MIDPNASIIITKELGANERLLWAGRPTTGVKFRGNDIFMVPFSVMWCGFAIFWETSVITTNAPFFFKMWGIPFVIVGLYFVFGRFIVEAKQRGKTFYGVTNERIIIVTSFMRSKMKTLSLRTLTDISLTEKNDKTGTITFGPTPPFYSWFGGSSWPGMGQQTVPSFELIDNARSVYGIINEAPKKA